MEYQIIEKLLPLGMNRPGTPLRPIGVIIHETATPNATAENEARFFSTGNRSASAHYFVDYQSIIRVIPENEVAWHAGPSANRRYLSIEICHFDDTRKFVETWKRAVWLAANMCKKYGWNPDIAVHSHAWVSRTYHETDHTDPEGYFAVHGRSMVQFLADVKRELAGQFLKEVLSMFKDVPESHWAAASIERLAKMGLIRGDGNGNFRPDQPITRAEVVALLDRVLKLLGR
ncbi:N-acetylmuramoyl-L-alanine amidase [Thermoanaerobacter thermohydrosulfuricus WC1]|uniref:N-acetylmuramoyl-L-alanine amidase n=1 Tax=Thermoanaerobacter thermohydrosulfuricus WC1 TaxID=1198630 RepID=M8CUH6_THETY|nr:N-acetylmuramoyl-L-alanine amidase [Thermoanaerobacter thermohydrosulfuricus]EMT38023.1 N-acetylmuramoyl-L-alanine amidase [Thermoanaerobacter thermohydrosulfuricus WC1]